MIEELGVTSDPKELGYYSGFVEGVFALAQFCTGERLCQVPSDPCLTHFSLLLGLPLRSDWAPPRPNSRPLRCNYLNNHVWIEQVLPNDAGIACT
jgi:hypothetical protein